MHKILLFTFLLSLCYFPVKAQFIGQTKTYFIKKYERCLIKNNLSDYLLMECYGYELLITFDENGLSNVFGIEVTIDNWNKYQTNAIWDGASCASRSIAPAIKSRIPSDVMIYTLGKVEFYFFDCDFDGNKETDMKSMTIKQHD